MFSNDKILLKKLTKQDAECFYKLYSHPELVISFDENPFLENETPTEFTQRIISLCEYIFTIRTKENPDLVIGDCALHHWNKAGNEIEIGGSLFPEYWGKGFMQAAFELLIELAEQDLGIQTVLGSTKTSNRQAIALAEKIGFKKCRVDENDTILRKELKNKMG